eukprot:SAG31_NODE_17_length_35773_cov_25.999271_13_plen_179_part_00
MGEGVLAPPPPPPPPPTAYVVAADGDALEPPLGLDWSLGFIGLALVIWVVFEVLHSTLRKHFIRHIPDVRYTFLFIAFVHECCLLRGWFAMRAKGTRRDLAPAHAGVSHGIDLASVGKFRPQASIKPSGKRFLAMRGWEVAPHEVRGWTMEDNFGGAWLPIFNLLVTSGSWLAVIHLL